MDAAAQQQNLQVLGQLLQERLQSEFPQTVPLEVRCVLKDGALMILGQHPESGVTLEPQLMLAALQQALQSLQPQVNQPVQVYLRLVGQKQPYAVDFFMLQPPGALPDVQPASIDNAIAENAASPSEEYRTSDNLAESMQVIDPAAESSSFEEPPHPLPIKRSSPRFSNLPMPILAGGAGVALATLLAGVYLLTRPCVIGECKPIQTAQQLSQESTQLTRQAKSEQELLAARQQLEQASNVLQTIPRWSSRYQEAQNLSQTFLEQSQTINQAVTALQKASVAAQKSQNPPHTAQEWQAILALWQGAIAPLEAMPRNSQVYSLAQQKLPGYRANLKSVEQQLNVEQQAAKKLTQALAAAKVATTRQEAAQSLQNWQQVQSNWQEAVNALTAIAKNSTADKQAQQLLANYRPKLNAVRDRTAKEQISAKAYNQAVNLATAAKRYEQQNQPAAAVNTWSQALNAAQQVPTETFYYSQAQPLLDTYSSALKQAQEKLKVANISQKARVDLNRTCSGSIRVCSYSLDNQGIIVRLTSDYERAFTTASGDAKAQAGVRQHFQTLRQALEVISNNVNLPLQIYNPQGTVIHTYRPGSSGEGSSEGDNEI